MNAEALRVVRHTALEALAPRAACWDELAPGVPFRTWAWNSHWWRVYGDQAEPCRPHRELFVLAVLDRDDRLVGLAPWYVDHGAARGRVVRFLGSGEVCSDYLAVLARPDMEDAVAASLADWLTQGSKQPASRSATSGDGWDLLELTDVDAADPATNRLAEHLRRRGHTVHCRPGPNCWRIELPGRWDDFLALLSKSHRRQLRRTERALLASGRVVLRTVTHLDELPAAQERLIDLHQRRRAALGQTGCFASERFRRFHARVMPELLRSGVLNLHCVELDGRTVAVEYQLAGGGTVYAYQAGVEPDVLRCSPGRLAHMTTVRRAIESGHAAFDFLRGDEPYKAHWRAAPRPSLELRAVPPRAAARLRHGLWLAGSQLRKWLRNSVTTTRDSQVGRPGKPMKTET